MTVVRIYNGEYDIYHLLLTDSITFHLLTLDNCTYSPLKINLNYVTLKSENTATTMDAMAILLFLTAGTFEYNKADK